MGRTPLHHAIRLDDGDLVRILLKNKADPNIQDYVTQYLFIINRNTIDHLSLLFMNPIDLNLNKYFKVSLEIKYETILININI